MEWVETTARSVQEAKERAIDMLGVAGDEAEFEVIEEASRGLLGLRRTDARVRARVRPTQPRAKTERRGRGRGGPGDRQRGGRSRNRGGGSKGAGSKGGGSKGGGSRGDGSRDEGAKSGQQRRSKASQAKASPAKASPAKASPAKASPPKASPPKDRVRSDDDSRRAKPPAREQESSMSEPSDDTVDAHEQAEAVVPFLEDLLVAFDLEGTVRTETIDEDTVEAQVEGDDLGLLIGPRGNTLRSIQELSRTVVQRRHPGRLNGRVRVDVSGYQRRRKEALEAFTRKLADGVLSSGQEKALEPMSAADRKIVHDTVVEIEGVRTASEGEEPNRRVVLIPESA